MPRQRHGQRGVCALEEDHELEEAGGRPRALAVVEVAKEVAEEALLVVVVLGRQVDVDDEGRVRGGGVLEAVVVAGLDGGAGLAE